MARKIKGKHSKQAEQVELGLQEARTALYIRVSTQLQAEEGYSLENQKERLQAYCTAQGWTVADENIYVDAGISGKSTDRPAFQAMIQAAQEGRIQRIVAMKLDRIARNTKDFLTTVEQLKAHNCALALVKENFETSTPQGKFAITLFAAIAEMEASMITERVMSGKQQKASKGGYNGGKVPFGYSYNNGEFATNEDQAELVRSIFKRFISCEPLLGIATWLNDAGISSPTGKLWSHQGVRYVLTNGFYAGLAEWDGTKGHIATHPAIVDIATYEAAAAKLATIGKGRPKNIDPLG